MPKGDCFFLHSFVTGQDRAEVEKLLVNKLKGFPGGLESSCQAGDAGLIPGLGRSSEEGNGNHSSILAWRIPWTEEPGGL